MILAGALEYLLMSCLASN